MKKKIFAGLLTSVLLVSPVLAGKDPKYSELWSMYSSTKKAVQASSKADADKSALVGKLDAMIKEADEKRADWNMDRHTYYDFADKILARMKQMQGN